MQQLHLRPRALSLSGLRSGGQIPGRPQLLESGSGGCPRTEKVKRGGTLNSVHQLRPSLADSNHACVRRPHKRLRVKKKKTKTEPTFELIPVLSSQSRRSPRQKHQRSSDARHGTQSLHDVALTAPRIQPEITRHTNNLDTPTRSRENIVNRGRKGTLTPPR